ncbi:MAG TPA: AarF/UbiB family protein [Kofleriaceae bacterium]|jgi:predicted unusual protein kinase regulating ubiquinone biosynthesis (AarF/ABC1/UbiB family)|nr:AarF/UbiB family protein [Kofleriaceae bacterium]
MAEPAAQGDPPAARDARRAERPVPAALEDSTALVGQESRRYRAVTQSRPPPLRIRSLRAYWVTFVVIGSYLWLRLRARFHDGTWAIHAMRATHLRNARRIERGICELQGLFIKVGQLISIMTNFLPEEFRRELEGLQDAVPPRPYEDIAARVVEELHRPPTELFASFDERPIASASIGQVHLAQLLDGTKVAVKVQYPEIEEVVQRDLNTLRRIFWIIGWFIPYQGLPELYREIRSIVMEELDYHAEASNAERIAANFVDRSDVAFPQVVHALSTARVLTTHFEAGCKITDRPGVKQLGLDRGELARQVVEIYCQQIFTDGVYHADPHPGNLLVRPGAPSAEAASSAEAAPGAPGSEAAPSAEAARPTIVFLDFGAVAEIPSKVRQGMIELVQGALTRDTRRIVNAMKQMGFVARGANEHMFEQVVEYFHEKFQENISLDALNLKDIKFDPQRGLESVADLRKMDISLRELSVNFHIPKEIIVLERTLLLLMGLCTELDPTLNPMTVIRPYLERFVLGDGDWSELLVETSKDLVMSVTALPAEIRKFMRAAHAGELQLKFKNIEAPAQLMYRLGHQLLYAAVGISGAAIAIVLEGRGDDARAIWGWWTARIAGVVLVWSWWTTRGLLRKR